MVSIEIWKEHFRCMAQKGHTHEDDIDADSYIGNWRKNPLNFQHYDIQRAAFYIDDESIAKPPYKLDPKNGQFIEPFMELYSILGKAG